MIEKIQDRFISSLIFGCTLTLMGSTWTLAQQDLPPLPPPSAKAQTSTQSHANSNQDRLLLVVGVPGEERYRESFAKIAQQWNSICQQANLELTTIGLPRDSSETNKTNLTDRERLLNFLTQQIQQPQTLWIVFVGHGTFDGKKARFNLRGKDITARELRQTLKARTHPTLIINCASSSAPFLTALSAPNRAIVTATKSGSQYNATVFGESFVAAAANVKNDLDKDGNVSLLEVYLAASNATDEFYRSQQRIATEKSLLDDNGDQKGTPANWFSGVRCVKRPKSKATTAYQVDGTFANQFFLIKNTSQSTLSREQVQQRAQLESELERHVARRNQMTEEDFLNAVEPILLDLAKLAELQNSKSPQKNENQSSNTNPGKN